MDKYKWDVERTRVRSPLRNKEATLSRHTISKRLLPYRVEAFIFVKRTIKMNTLLRVISKSGKLSLANTLLDEDGEFDRLLETDVDLSFRNITELRDLIEELRAAASLPILHISCCNKSIMGGN